MKIDIGSTLETLTLLQRQLGATEEPDLPAAVRTQLREAGFEALITELPVNREGILTWRGQVVVLYIRDQHQWGTQPSGYRFHVAECSTIQSMRTQGQGERYIVTNRADGRFPVRVGRVGPVEIVDMIVCKNCLKRVNWDGYADHNAKHRQIVADFKIVDFFSTYQNARLPKVTRPRPAMPPPAGPVPTPQVRLPPPVSVPAPATEVPVAERWAYAIEDVQFRQVALHLQRFGSLSASELSDMVGGPRRARRFDVSLDEWFRVAPFGVQVRVVLGVKSYHRAPQ